MKYVFLFLAINFLFAFTSLKHSDSSWFSNESLRIDFYLAGNIKQELAILKDMKREPYWGGNPNSMIDKMNLGDYRICLYDTTGNLLYSKGFSSLFREWQTTSEAKLNLNRSFLHVMQVPLPKNKVVISIDGRKKDGIFQTLLKWKVNPDDYLIKKEGTSSYPVDTVLYSGPSSKNLDIAFIPEGYTTAQMGKFKADAKRIKDYIFKLQPFSEYRNNMNMYAIQSPSEESGADIPGKHIYKKTLLDASWYTFDSERYLTVNNNEIMFNIAAQVPYDHVYVIVNSDVYGGSGFYNNYTCCTAGNQYSEQVASHEFAHGLCGLADEYFYDKDAIAYYYNLNKEPWEQNITTLVNFKSKWKGMVKAGTPVPTPRVGAYKSTLGAFERSAYTAKGIFSPMMDCRMKTNSAPGLCPVCQAAARRVIDSYIK